MTNAMKNPQDPITVEEMQEAIEQFMPLFNLVFKEMPEGSTTEDTLKTMEACVKLGHQLRRKKKTTAPFGFNKAEESEDK